MPKPKRYDYPDEEDDDGIDMDIWMGMTEAEQDRELAAAMRDFEEVYRRLTPRQVYRRSRRLALRSCLKWRSYIRDGFLVPLSEDSLRKAQVRLVELRAARETGTQPGEA